MTVQKTGTWFAHYKLDNDGNAVFVHHGENPSGCCDVEFLYETKRDLILNRPEVALIESNRQKELQKQRLNEIYSTIITEKHSSKYTEALFWTSGVITDPYQLPHLVTDALKYLDSTGDDLNLSMDKIAGLVIEQATSDVAIESERVFHRARV